MIPLNIGTATLKPLPVEPEAFEQFPSGQRITYNLIVLLGRAVDGIVTEKGLALCMGLKSSLPVRSRIEHLVQRGALEVIPC